MLNARMDNNTSLWVICYLETRLHKLNADSLDTYYCNSKRDRIAFRVFGTFFFTLPLLIAEMNLHSSLDRHPADYRGDGIGIGNFLPISDWGLG
jgi:hypothetical protein